MENATTEEDKEDAFAPIFMSQSVDKTIELTAISACLSVKEWEDLPMVSALPVRVQEMNAFAEDSTNPFADEET